MGFFFFTIMLNFNFFFSFSVQCGGDITVNGTGEITSPHFPLRYPDEVNCEWKICVDDGSRIKLTFFEFEV